MDGSVSTLAPVFAAAFATRNSWDAFLVGAAASIGAGISMGFAEALSDDGSLTGRGHPWIRGFICGLMTTLGGIGHTLPYLIKNFGLATTRCSGRGGDRTSRDLAYPPQVHGYAVSLGGVAGHGGRCAGVYHRHPDREFLAFQFAGIMRALGMRERFNFGLTGEHVVSRTSFGASPSLRSKIYVRIL